MATATTFDWIVSSTLLVAISTVSTLFGLKALFDPGFSHFIAPGPGSPLFGDSGNMLSFEAELQSKFYGAPTRLLEGLILGVGGGIVLATCWRPSAFAQSCTLLITPVIGAWYLLSAIYFPLVGAVDMMLPCILLGLLPFLLCMYRIRRLDADMRFSEEAAPWAVYSSYLCSVGGLLVAISAYVDFCTPQFQEDIRLLIRVRAHFETNGMAWAPGNPYPDGFALHPWRWWWPLW